MAYIIPIEGNLTSYSFYNVIIRYLHNYFANNNADRILFDFTNARLIDPLVLPNLLCAGYWIAELCDHPAEIFVPGNSDFASTRTFLSKTRFVSLAQQYNLFEFNSEISGNLTATNYRSTLNRIELFQNVLTDDGEIDIQKTRQSAWNQLDRSLTPFIEEFLSRSSEKWLLRSKDKVIDILLSVCREIIENSLFHGLCFCFLDMQYIPWGKQIKISISDCGKGFKNAINADQKRSQRIVFLNSALKNCTDHVEKLALEAERDLLRDECYPLGEKDTERLSGYPYMHDELQGIVYGLLARKSSKRYGLYDVLDQVVAKMDGTIRLHSNDTQLILTKKMWLPLMVCNTPQSLAEQLSAYPKNVRKNLRFRGSHIEIEFPLERQGGDS